MDITRATPTLPHTRQRRLRSAGHLTVAEWDADYGDGRAWHVASVFEFREGLVARKTDYFAAASELTGMATHHDRPAGLGRRLTRSIGTPADGRGLGATGVRAPRAAAREAGRYDP